MWRPALEGGEKLALWVWATRWRFVNLLLASWAGVCTTGSTVGQAWVRAWYFEKCCQLQMDVLKSSRPYRVLSTEQLESSKASLDAEFPPGVHEWPAVLRRWEAEGVARWRSQL